MKRSAERNADIVKRLRRRVNTNDLNADEEDHVCEDNASQVNGSLTSDQKAQTSLQGPKNKFSDNAAEASDDSNDNPKARRRKDIRNAGKASTSRSGSNTRNSTLTGKPGTNGAKDSTSNSKGKAQKATTNKNQPKSDGKAPTSSSKSKTRNLTPTGRNIVDKESASNGKSKIIKATPTENQPTSGASTSNSRNNTRSCTSNKYEDDPKGVNGKRAIKKKLTQKEVNVAQSRNIVNLDGVVNSRGEGKKEKQISRNSDDGSGYLSVENSAVVLMLADRETGCYKRSMPYLPALQRKRVIANYLSEFRVANFPNKFVDDFSNRVTALSWHHSDPRLFGVGTKSGRVDVGRFSEKGLQLCPVSHGVGPGYSINVIKFHPHDVHYLYTTSIEGRFSKVAIAYDTIIPSGVSTDLYAIEESISTSLWFTSLDLCPNNGKMVVGDTKGFLRFFSPDGKLQSTVKAHRKEKISHIEFNAMDCNVLCTASNDKTVKLWDLRMIKMGGNTDEEVVPLVTVKEKSVRPFNAATFSCTNSCRLLVTDQADTIEVFRAPLWNLEKSIKHPHRFFQHLTPIRACWHPNEDIIVIGRYPEKGSCDLRTVDFIDADTGLLILQLLEHDDKPSLKSINVINSTGDIMLSSAGQNIKIWTHKDRRPIPLHNIEDIDGDVEVQ